jgi:hypothetical protein
MAADKTKDQKCENQREGIDETKENTQEELLPIRCIMQRITKF